MFAALIKSYIYSTCGRGHWHLFPSNSLFLPSPKMWLKDDTAWLIYTIIPAMCLTFLWRTCLSFHHPQNVNVRERSEARSSICSLLARLCLAKSQAGSSKGCPSPPGAAQHCLVCHSQPAPHANAIQHESRAPHFHYYPFRCDYE